MKKYYSKILTSILFICLCVVSLGNIFALNTKQASAEAAPQSEVGSVFSIVNISTTEHQYSSADLIDGKLYINSSLSIKNKTLHGYNIYYDGSSSVLTTNGTYVVEYDGSGIIKTLQIGIYSIDIVHVKANFKNTNIASWNGEVSPTYNSTYSAMNIELNNSAASEQSPIFITMHYNGQQYTFAYDGTKISANNEEYTLSSFTLKYPGSYTIEIYDNTYYTKNINSNYEKYSFNILPSGNVASNFELGLTQFFMTLTAENGEQLATGSYTNNEGKLETAYEYTNSSVTLHFHNVSKIKSLFYDSGVVVKKSFDDDTGHHNPITFYPWQTLENIGSKITLTDHADYTIEVVQNYDSTYQTYTPFNYYTTKVFILKDIQKSGIIINGIKHETNELNSVKTPLVRNTITNKYSIADGVSITGIHNSQAYVKIVNAQPSISGIENNTSTSETVNLTINGVGVITVEISINGSSTSPKYVRNGDTLPFSDAGTYYIKITDEMGNILTRSFTINAKMNTATLILIILGSIALLVIVLFIIKTRRKVKVK